jgi:hypothetical protein
MRNKKLYPNLSLAYLSIVPVLTAILGFSIGNTSYRLYLPIWGSLFPKQIISLRTLHHLFLPHQLLITKQISLGGTVYEAHTFHTKAYCAGR